MKLIYPEEFIIPDNSIAAKSEEIFHFVDHRWETIDSLMRICRYNGSFIIENNIKITTHYYINGNYDWGRHPGKIKNEIDIS